MGDPERPTLADYRDKHSDFKTTIDGDRYVTQMVPGKGTCLRMIAEDYEQ